MRTILKCFWLAITIIITFSACQKTEQLDPKHSEANKNLGLTGNPTGVGGPGVPSAIQDCIDYYFDNSNEGEGKGLGDFIITPEHHTSASKLKFSIGFPSEFEFLSGFENGADISIPITWTVTGPGYTPTGTGMSFEMDYLPGSDYTINMSINYYDFLMTYYDIDDPNDLEYITLVLDVLFGDLEEHESANIEDLPDFLVINKSFCFSISDMKAEENDGPGTTVPNGKGKLNSVSSNSISTGGSNLNSALASTLTGNVYTGGEGVLTWNAWLFTQLVLSGELTVCSDNMPSEDSSSQTCGDNGGGFIFIYP